MSRDNLNTRNGVKLERRVDHSINVPACPVAFNIEQPHSGSGLGLSPDPGLQHLDMHVLARGGGAYKFNEFGGHARIMDEMETLSLEAEFTKVFLLLCVGWDLQRGVEVFRRRLAVENFAFAHAIHPFNEAFFSILAPSSKDIRSTRSHIIQAVCSTCMMSEKDLGHKLRKCGKCHTGGIAHKARPKPTCGEGGIPKLIRTLISNEVLQDILHACFILDSTSCTVRVR
ncbi:hypothetical protein B0H13DRAFT_1917197 [Mycena leptocephala]|nr:hypothetical protein B0H13DRAFT_1917197 [Mycena leptocephala]